MHKELIVLGLLDEGPMHGHELHRIVRAHGELYSDLKKANLYHLLARLREDGYLKLRTEVGARGRRGERLVYAITAKGRNRLATLLREVVRSYETMHSGIEVAAVLMSSLPLAESVTLLQERRKAVRARKAILVKEFAEFGNRGVFPQISADHVIATTDAELAWIDRALKRLSSIGGVESGNRSRGNAHA
jgi:DNA-binding PadR family transcriptional regulator